MARRGGLGTNLDALIPTSLTVGDKEVGQQNEVAITSISPNPRQPRTHFDPVALEELIASIKEIGILQPIKASCRLRFIVRNIVAGFESYSNWENLL